MRHSIRLVAALLACALLGLPAHGQGIRPPSLDSLLALGLDSLRGSSVVYYRPSDRIRALAMHALLSDFVEHFGERSAIRVTLRVAVLGPEDWSRLTRLPYGLPNNSGPPDNLLLAATVPPDSIGLRALPGGRLTDLLTVGHEGGHLLVWALLPDTLRHYLTSDDDIPPGIRQRFANIGQSPGWYHEFAANYFIIAYLDGRHPEASSDWRAFLRRDAASGPHRFTHLADWYGAAMQAMSADSTPYVLTREGGANQSWYQAVTGLAAAHVYHHQGLAFVDHVRRAISGEPVPATPQLVEEINSLAPGFKALLDSLGARHTEPSVSPR